MKICYILDKVDSNQIIRLNALNSTSELSVIETNPEIDKCNRQEKLEIDFSIAILAKSNYKELARILQLKAPAVITITNCKLKELLWAMSWAVKHSIPVLVLSKKQIKVYPNNWIQAHLSRYLLSSAGAAIISPEEPLTANIDFATVLTYTSKVAIQIVKPARFRYLKSEIIYHISKFINSKYHIQT